MTLSKNKEIWVVCDLRSPRFFGLGLNLLSKAGELARAVSGKSAALILDREFPDPSAAVCGPVTDPAGECIAHGADRVFALTHEALAVPRADLFAEALAEFISQRPPLLVLFPLTDFGRETAARTARLLNVGLIADCADLQYDAHRGFVASCPAWGGEIMAEIAFSDPVQTGLATVQPHAFVATATTGDPGMVETVPIHGMTAETSLRLVASEIEPAMNRKLEEADIVVAGGAGLGSSQGFGRVRELAAALGAEVGATRPPVLQHWVAEERLIGQTGKSIRPRLLFSIGISGAIQYTAGIREAQTVVAVNRDPSAPIFKTADIGVVSDAKSWLPIFTAKVNQAVMRRLADELCAVQPEDTVAGFGGRVQKLREGRDWSVEELARATGQSPDFIEQVERNETTPPVSFLLGLAQAFDVDPGMFLLDPEKNAIHDARAQAFIKRTRNYSYQTFTPGAEEAHLRAFLVTIEPRQAHKPVAYKHQGEEFIYVLEGALEVDLDGRIHHLKTLETIHFNSETPHKLKSLSTVPTRFIDVLYTP